MKKQKWTVLFMAAFFFGMTLLCWAKPSEEYSDQERRKLAQFPELTMSNILSGKFMSKFEDYALDQFPARDGFMALSQVVSTTKDKNGLYEADGHIVSMEYPMDEAGMERAAGIFKGIQEQFAKDSDIYLAVLPDKNAFLGNENGYLAMDYEAFYEKMKQETGFAYIDIASLLELEDYYFTDGHWRQESIVDVAEKLAAEMGTSISGSYEVNTLEQPFYGAYYGQLATNLPADEIKYLTNETIEQMKTFDFQNNKEIDVYDMEKAFGKDAYELFVSGPLSLITIENPACKNGKELIIFRDSFGSSIAPLLAEGYEKVTLVDIRYIASKQVCQMIDFSDADVLFLYSTLVLNNAETLK